MKGIVLIFTLIVAFVLAGCGGSGGGGHTEASVFQGPFAGTWTSTDGSNGTASIEVDASGDFDGAFVNITDSLNGTFHGTITGDGAFDGTITLGGNDYDGTGQFQLSQDENTMTGTFTRSGTTWTFTLTRNV